jgi:hypothetical protein
MEEIKVLPWTGCVTANGEKEQEIATALLIVLAPSVIFWSAFTFNSTCLLSQHFFEELCFIFIPHSTLVDENFTVLSLPQQ